MQTTSNLLLVTAKILQLGSSLYVNEGFKKDLQKTTTPAINRQAQVELDNMAKVLQKNGLNLFIIEDNTESLHSDSIFVNDWLSLHTKGTAVLFPIHHSHQRLQNKQEIIEKLKVQQFNVRNILDLTHYENKGKFLDGLGSLVLDREHQTAYACISTYTHGQVVDNFCHLMQFGSVTFEAFDNKGMAIFHTNMVLTITDKFAIICMEAIPDEIDRRDLLDSFKTHHREVIQITYEQMFSFLANTLQVISNTGERLLLLSEQAFKSLKEDQLKRLTTYYRLVHFPLDTFEAYTGRSVNSLLVPIHLPVW